MPSETPEDDPISVGSNDLSGAAYDPELEALPPPRRPWRLATLVSLGVLGVAALFLVFSLRSQVTYALKGGQPRELGSLTELRPSQESANSWVHGTGSLSKQAVGYRRPLDGDRFRLAPVEGNPKLWVELREPAGARNEFFIPPVSFVGKLVPLSDPGIRHSDLLRALGTSQQPAPAADAWLLIDGESPRASRWALGVVALLLAFTGFSIWGVITLLRPARGV